MTADDSVAKAIQASVGPALGAITQHSRVQLEMVYAVRAASAQRLPRRVAETARPLACRAAHASDADWNAASAALRVRRRTRTRPHGRQR